MTVHRQTQNKIKKTQFKNINLLDQAGFLMQKR